jgi:microcystin-dependent protein
MATPFLGEIKIFSFTFPPQGWALCNGQILPISQNSALFSLLGTTYGGDGVTTFALPNLQGRIPIHNSSAFVLGQAGGEQTHYLGLAEMPAHTHQPQANTGLANKVAPAGNVWANGNQAAYAPAGAPVPMSPATVGNAGSGQPHKNMPPYLVLNFCIALQGIFPSRS